MKKVLLAALAIAAMASCAKNEPAVQLQQSDSPISFLPVVGNSTKATYLTTTNMKDHCQNFGVFAWMTTNEFASEYATASEFMKNVKVSYKEGDFISDETGTGAWFPEKSYYWPNNKKLTFDAYAPADLGSGVSVTSDNTTGLKISDYTVSSTLATQQDLLYTKERSIDKTKNKDGSPTGGLYDGVDLNFKHALSAIEIYARNADDKGGTNGIKITSVKIKNAYNKGTFTQNYENGLLPAGGDASKWDISATATEESYTVFDGSSTPIDVPFQVEAIKIGDSAILMPQQLSHSGSSNVSLVVSYKVRTDGSEYAAMDDVTIDISNAAIKDGSSNITSWDINKRYIYTLVFDLDKIFFAPIVADWDTVTAAEITIK